MNFGWTEPWGSFGSHDSVSLGDTTALTAARAADLFTTTRSGAQLHIPTGITVFPGDYEEAVANQAILFPYAVPGCDTVTGLLPQGAAAALVTQSNRLDNAAWTKSANVTAAWVPDATSAFGGYSLLTATAAATVTRTVTRASANRAMLFKAEPVSGAAPLVSMDGGTTQVTLPAGYSETELPAVTRANFDIEIEFPAAGVARIYDVQGQEPPAGVPMFRAFKTQGAVLDTVGAATYQKTLPSAPASLNFSILVQLRLGIVDDAFFFEVFTNSSARTGVFVENGDIKFFRIANATASQFTVGVAKATAQLLDVEWTGTTIRARLDQGAWTTLAATAIPTFEKITFGNRFEPIAGTLALNSPILAFRDNAGTLGLDKDGWNHDAIECFETTGLGLAFWVDDDGAYFVDDDGAFILLEV